MGEKLGVLDTLGLIGLLEGLLDELDRRNLLQAAAKLASAIDTLRLEAESENEKA